MDLKDFVAVSLQQILEGIREAQRESIEGLNINASNDGVPTGKNIFTGAYGTFTLVEFDVAVSAETNAKGDANLKVFGTGASGQIEHKAGSANRIAFAVPVRLPDG